MLRLNHLPRLATAPFKLLVTRRCDVECCCCCCCCCWFLLLVLVLVFVVVLFIPKSTSACLLEVACPPSRLLPPSTHHPPYPLPLNLPSRIPEVELKKLSETPGIVYDLFDKADVAIPPEEFRARARGVDGMLVMLTDKVRGCCY